MADGFLGRWAKRKEAVRQGKELPAEPQAKPAAPPEVAAATMSAPATQATAPVLEPPPAPTLEEAQALTPESDFRRFAGAGVDPQVKNAAMKKLFADPHFNVMDGLDTYIDDYSRPDPIPPEMLRQLTSAKFLKLFEEEEKKEEQDEAAAAKGPDTREVADDPAPESVAQSGSRTGPALPPGDHHADPDLRLQQDDAPGPRGPGAGSG
ncbi:MAG TPA: DUF3306 domain-containing protein [Ramlibacter sp.]|nr:DUF3306 domain-containing protein [Ramlibacter sp.]